MRRNLSKRLWILCLASFLMATPNIFAANDLGADDENENENRGLTEKTIINNMLNRMSKEGEDPKYGPRSFKEVTLHATKKKVYVPLWFNEQLPKPEDNPDPFRPAVKKELPPPPPPRTRDNGGIKPPKPREERKVIPPLKIFVKGIVGNEENGRFAIVEFEKEEMTIRKEQIVEGKFKVVDIYSDRIVVYSNAEQKRYTFKIGGEEK